MKIIARYYLALFMAASISIGSSFLFTFDDLKNNSTYSQTNARIQAVEWRGPSIEPKATVARNLDESSNCSPEDEKNCNSTYRATLGN